MSAKLFYLVGASGSGKDSILRECRKRLSQGEPSLGNGFFIAHRYITREPELCGENHVWLSDAEFTYREEIGAFAMSWQANGYAYGIGVEIDAWLGRGINVLLNGSRGYMAEALKRYPETLVPIDVRVDPECLKARLIKRGRESMSEIDQRVARAQLLGCDNDPRVRHIENNRGLESAVEALIAVINSHADGHHNAQDMALFS